MFNDLDRVFFHLLTEPQQIEVSEATEFTPAVEGAQASSVAIAAITISPFESLPEPWEIAAQTPPLLAQRRSRRQQVHRALLLRDGDNYKGQFAHRVGGARSGISRETPFNKLVRYYIQGGMHAKAQRQILEALQNLYEIMLARPDHELIMRLGGYSPAVGHLIYTTAMHNPNNLLAWVAKEHSQSYAFRSFCTPKQIRKRTRIRQSVHCVHVPRTARLSQSLRMLHFFTEEQKYQKLEERIFFALIDVIFKYKKGVLYQRKLLAYRSAFSRARQGKTA